MLGAKRAVVYPGNISRSPSSVDEPLGFIQSSAGKSFAECRHSGCRLIAGRNRSLRQYGRSENQHKRENASQHVHGLSILPGTIRTGLEATKQNVPDSFESWDARRT